MPSSLGARKAAAAKLIRQGIVRSFSEYMDNLVEGKRWCSDCRAFHIREMLATDAGRAGGRAGRCRKSRRQRIRRRP